MAPRWRHGWPIFSAVVSGEIQGGTAGSVLPNIACLQVMFKAEYDNAGRIYVGTGTTVTKADGTTDTTTGLQLSAGEQTPWLSVANLNQLSRICDNNGDDLTYIALL